MQVIVENAVNLLDMSYIQDILPINPKVISEAGFQGVYVKSSQYSSTADLKFTSLTDRLRDAGLRVGAYHFCAHDSDPIRQAEFFFRAARGIGSKPGELPPMADWEHCTPSFYQDHPEHCVQWLEKFVGRCDELWYPNNNNSIKPRFTVVYTFPNYASTHQPALSGSTSLGKRPLCFASYKSGPDGKEMPYIPALHEVPYHKTPRPWTKPMLVQYSGSRGAKVPGVQVPCDRQVFTGSVQEFDEFCGLGRPVESNIQDAAVDTLDRK